ncbi:sugar ABC transporter permease [Clostridium thermosuccinogenes]|uniref:Sugar ABC transporter permease n=2 Tax=Clostridium thermosuccinogenes TaxID=84032 RepID=A0A2K2EVY1_9CLOT|nr:sugar ABC transporter permease [Pseudoclostridium thermosuccinogenes]PNT90686.1 sugar ABC transporter permease [Pseudoclostridium thermosuccinogenes]PNT97296.1 sugar ABC transporter permease [Pseudoclostridium thermosuccinogenes]PNT99273.1 sugar ABC transporter permease [Pseudoclostridium thermosuccinogenes]
MLIILNYIPMYGITLAFKDYVPSKGILGSPWVGLKYFERFFNSFSFSRILSNTLKISFASLIFGFPVPVIFALMLNQLRQEKFKRMIQTITYAPHFISTVVLVGMMMVFLSPRSGLINNIIQMLGGEPIFFMAKKEWFIPLYILSDIWQNTGWNTIIYLAALTSVNPELYEAAIVDGATKLQRIKHIDIPAILPTIVITLIFACGGIMNVGFEKVFLMQNSLNREVSDVIATYVFEQGLIRAQYSYSTAIGLFNTIVNIILLITVNKIAKKLTDTSLW